MGEDSERHLLVEPKSLGKRKATKLDYEKKKRQMNITSSRRPVVEKPTRGQDETDDNYKKRQAAWHQAQAAREEQVQALQKAETNAYEQVIADIQKYGDTDSPQREQDSGEPLPKE